MTMQNVTKAEQVRAIQEEKKCKDILKTKEKNKDDKTIIK